MWPTQATTQGCSQGHDARGLADTSVEPGTSGARRAFERRNVARPMELRLLRERSRGAPAASTTCSHHGTPMIMGVGSRW